MSDGLSFPPLTDSTDFNPYGPLAEHHPSDQAQRAPDSLNLTTFHEWIELQPVTTITGLLDLIGNECYRRELFSAGNEIKHAVAELRA